MYRCVCHTCKDTDDFEALGDAQECFNDHADRRHEVELHNVMQEPTPGVSEYSTDEEAVERGPPADE